MKAKELKVGDVFLCNGEERIALDVSNAPYTIDWGYVGVWGYRCGMGGECEVTYSGATLPRWEVAKYEGKPKDWTKAQRYLDDCLKSAVAHAEISAAAQRLLTVSERHCSQNGQVKTAGRS